MYPLSPCLQRPSGQLSTGFEYDPLGGAVGEPEAAEPVAGPEPATESTKSSSEYEAKAASLIEKLENEEIDWTEFETKYLTLLNEVYEDQDLTELYAELYQAWEECQAKKPAAETTPEAEKPADESSGQIPASRKDALLGEDYFLLLG